MKKKDYTDEQEVLASFVTQVVEKHGWWFRLPKWNPNVTMDKEIAQDIIMPHFGQLFGLTEEASAYVLVEMGLMKQQKNRSITYNRVGWESFSGQFILDDVVETKNVSFDGKQYWYVRIGLVDKNFKSCKYHC